MPFVIDADRIRELRIAKNMSQRDLSLQSDISITLISAIENKKKRTPNISTVEKLAKALGTSEVDLLINIKH